MQTAGGDLTGVLAVSLKKRVIELFREKRFQVHQ